jgi:hypothetical protein
MRLPTVRSILRKNLFDSSQKYLLLNEVKCGHDLNTRFYLSRGMGLDLGMKRYLPMRRNTCTPITDELNAT